MDKQTANKRIVESYHEATNRKDLEKFNELFAPDFVNFAAGFPPIHGMEAMKKLLKELLDAFPDWHVSIEDIFSEEDKVVVRWKLHATHLRAYKDIAPTGRKIVAEGIHIDHLVNGKIQKRWACNNFSEVFSTLRKNG